MHAVLPRNLLGLRAADAFGKRGRAELAAAALAAHQRYELDSALRLAARSRGAVKVPGPLRAFRARILARRGSLIASVSPGASSRC